MKQLTDYERGFIEGVIDSEGSITLNKNKLMLRKSRRGWTPNIRLEIVNNSLDLLNKIQRILGTNITPVLKKGTRCYKIALRHSVLRELFPQISLVIKENRRLLALELMNTLRVGINKYTNSDEYENRIQEIVQKWK
jgi:hypothetical protein